MVYIGAVDYEQRKLKAAKALSEGKTEPMNEFLAIEAKNVQNTSAAPDILKSKKSQVEILAADMKARPGYYAPYQSGPGTEKSNVEVKYINAKGKEVYGRTDQTIKLPEGAKKVSSGTIRAQKSESIKQKEAELNEVNDWIESDAVKKFPKSVDLLTRKKERVESELDIFRRQEALGIAEAKWADTKGGGKQQIDIMIGDYKTSISFPHSAEYVSDQQSRADEVFKKQESSTLLDMGQVVMQEFSENPNLKNIYVNGQKISREDFIVSSGATIGKRKDEGVILNMSFKSKSIDSGIGTDLFLMGITSAKFGEGVMSGFGNTMLHPVKAVKSVVWDLPKDIITGNVGKYSLEYIKDEPTEIGTFAGEIYGASIAFDLMAKSAGFLKDVAVKYAVKTPIGKYIPSSWVLKTAKVTKVKKPPKGEMTTVEYAQYILSEGKKGKVRTDLALDTVTKTKVTRTKVSGYWRDIANIDLHDVSSVKLEKGQRIQWTPENGITLQKYTGPSVRNYISKPTPFVISGEGILKIKEDTIISSKKYSFMNDRLSMEILESGKTSTARKWKMSDFIDPSLFKKTPQGDSTLLSMEKGYRIRKPLSLEMGFGGDMMIDKVFKTERQLKTLGKSGSIGTGQMQIETKLIRIGLGEPIIAVERSTGSRGGFTALNMNAAVFENMRELGIGKDILVDIESKNKRGVDIFPTLEITSVRDSSTDSFSSVMNFLDTGSSRRQSQEPEIDIIQNLGRDMKIGLLPIMDITPGKKTTQKKEIITDIPKLEMTRIVMPPMFSDERRPTGIPRMFRQVPFAIKGFFDVDPKADFFSVTMTELELGEKAIHPRATKKSRRKYGIDVRFGEQIFPTSQMKTGLVGLPDFKNLF